MSNKCIFVVLLVVFGCLAPNYTEACSCMPSHPQDQYCQSDFVILARVRKVFPKDHYVIYKTKIRKEFKMSDKARTALKSGRFQTPLEESMCGVKLDPGKLYVITGRIYGLQAHVNLCGLVQPWREVTPRQRKGFRLLYSKGCTCQISRYLHASVHKDKCLWTKNLCESKFGICLRAPNGFCSWSKSLDLRKCIKGDYKPEIKTTGGYLVPKPTPKSYFETNSYNSAANNFKYHQHTGNAKIV